MQVCHKCDNKSCVNPNHLFVGTASDNIRDFFEKYPNRARRGTASARATITEDDVRFIRARYAEGGVSHGMIAEQLGCTKGTVTEVLAGRSWKHVE